ncbi:MAG TPA: CpsD/CapB family tyrosine-protein kinase [Terriglobales bacterium]|jgi:capsular exopolysaccharide synthesis family protein|nr:CpsD/CapB family tyrosine-protein kinase [Terriglobales bacterium]
MSHIFDALQRSEAEQSGEAPALAVATELIQAVERKATTEREPVVERGFAVEHEIGPEIGTLGPNPTALDEFPSLQVAVNPQSRLVSLVDHESLAAEKFRFLGVRLRQFRQNRPLKKILITSSIPQEGKSMVAANLACTLARRQQQKTLLLDGDLRRPALSQTFGLGHLPGLCDWLQSEPGPMRNIYRLEGPGCWFLPAGSSPKNPLELMQSGRLSVLMEQLTAWFDWIVIDSPPVLPLGDTSIWTRLADGVLLVTRQGATQKQQLQRGLEAIDQSKLIGALLNSSREAASGDYYSRYVPSPAVAQDNSPEK